jgi:cell division protein ZapB
MNKEDIKTAELDLRKLEGRIEDLIETCTNLKEENQVLRQTQEKLMAERAELIEKTEIAKSRVEAMISRLRSMEVHL